MRSVVLPPAAPPPPRAWRRGRLGASPFGTLAVGLLVLAVCGLAVLGGAAAGLGSPLLLALPLAIPVALLFLVLPASLWIWCLVVLSLLVVGPAIYFAKIEMARWITPLLSLALLVPLALRAFAPRRAGLLPPPAFVWWLALFLVWVAFTTAINQPRLGEVINSPRYYLVAVPLTLLLMLGALSADQFERVWRFIVFAVVVQLPVAAAQYFVYAAQQVRSASWDAVVGTFPGNAEGGGASAAMGIYLLTAIAFALALWRRGHLSGRWLSLIALSALGTIALAEVKAVVLLMPVVLGLTYLRELRRRPWMAMAAVAAGLALTAAVLSFYDRSHYDESANGGRQTSRPTSPLGAVQNQLDPEQINRFAPPSRAASFAIWWDRNVGSGDAIHALAGFGAASTQANRLGVGKLATQYWYPLTQTSTSLLLWETGLVGHLLLVIALLAAAHKASRLAIDPRIPAVHRALLHASAVSLVLHTITLPYKSFIFMTAPSQVLLALLLGFVAYWSRTRPSPAGEEHTTGPVPTHAWPRA